MDSKMIFHDEWILNIKKLLDTQRFIFLTFVSDQSLIDQFNNFIQNQQLFLEQNLSSSNICEEQNFSLLETNKTEEYTLKNELSEVNIGTAHWKEEEQQEEDTSSDEHKSIKEDPEKEGADADGEQNADNEMCIVLPVGDNFKCTVCSENFKTENLLFQHYPKVHDIYKQFQCPAIGCTANYRRIKSLDEHTRLHHKDEKIFECKNCSEMFELKSQLRYHNKTAHDTLLTCIDCGVVCVSKLKLRNHRKENHPGEKSYSCTLCSSKFLYERSLETHKQTIHGRKETHTCDYCNKTFISQSHFKDHITTHGEKTFSCEYCEKKFYSKYRVNSHMKESHVDLGRYQCDQCEFSCPTNRRLKRHSVKHNDSERNFSCVYCGAL